MKCYNKYMFLILLLDIIIILASIITLSIDPSAWAVWLILFFSCVIFMQIYLNVNNIKKWILGFISLIIIFSIVYGILNKTLPYGWIIFSISVIMFILLFFGRAKI